MRLEIAGYNHHRYDEIRFDKVLTKSVGITPVFRETTNVPYLIGQCAMTSEPGVPGPQNSLPSVVLVSC